MRLKLAFDSFFVMDTFFEALFDQNLKFSILDWTTIQFYSSEFGFHIHKDFLIISLSFEFVLVEIV